MEILCVGGSSEVGRNMFAVKVKDEVVVLDMGLQMDAYTKLTDDQEIIEISESKLLSVGAVPDVSSMKDWKSKVKAICISHAHLDHVGAVPYLAHHFNCPIYGTPFTIAVIQEILADQKVNIKNKLVAKQPSSMFRVSDNIKVEFINVTHSVPQTVMVVLHTPEGAVVYANDFKLDKFPLLGAEPDWKRMKEVAQKGVKALIIDTLYSNKHVKTPSERVAKEMLRDVLVGTNTDGRAIVVTTFASHIARIKTIVEFAEQLKRKPIFVGRSIAKYVRAAKSVGLGEFSNGIKVVKYRSEVEKYMKKLKNPEQVLLLVTGHQAEPKAVLSRMVKTGLFRFKPGDMVVFSSAVIPTPVNIQNRKNLEEDLHRLKVRIFTDIHVSGHAAREDHRDLLYYILPEHLFPVHGTPELSSGFLELAKEMNYPSDKVHLLAPGKRVRL